jgi:hypothetical protein
MENILGLSTDRWAIENFGSIPLHALRRKQLLRVAVIAATKPSGTISEASRSAADRQSMYGFVENEAIDHELIVTAIGDATAQRCRGYAFVWVPIDGSSLSVTDTQKSKGTGRVGSPPSDGRGLKTMGAIAISPDGTPVGLAELHLWSRAEKKRSGNHQLVPFEQRESHRWNQIALRVHQRFATHTNGCRPWFQVDREGDFVELLLAAKQHELLLTARSRCDRRLATGGRLRSRVKRRRPLGEYDLPISARHGQPARVARIQVRSCKVTILLRERPSDREHAVELDAVHAREMGLCPGHARIEWLLLTTYDVDSFEAARHVIDGYSHRWAIEEFHRTWKSGLCKAESMQLRSFGALGKWATILASVAMRAMYLAQTAREKPNEPATTAFSTAELEALVVMRQPKGIESIEGLTVAQAVRWVADLGGYIGNNNSGAPGKVTIGRGLRELEIAVFAIARYENARAKRPRSKRD